jgi:DNA-binding transcriptional LysR family regulator
LYTKRGRGIALTIAGRELGTEARKIVEGMQVLKGRYGDPTFNKQSERLVVGGSHSLSTWILPRLIAKYKLANPQVKVSLRTKTSAVIERLVVELKVDIAVITNSPSSSLLTVEPYRQEHMVIAISRHHALAQKGLLTPAEFAQCPLIIRDRRNTSSRKFLAQLDKQCYQPNILMTCDSALGVQNAVRAGLGIGILSRENVKHEIKNGELKILKVNGLQEPYLQSFIIYRADREFSRFTRDFHELVQDSRNKQRPVPGRP